MCMFAPEPVSVADLGKDGRPIALARARLQDIARTGRRSPLRRIPYAPNAPPLLRQPAPVPYDNCPARRPRAGGTHA